MACLYFIVPFALLSAVAAIIYQSKAINFSPNNASPEETLQMVKSFYWNVAQLLLANSFTQAAILSTIYGYIGLYVEKGAEGFTLFDVWDEFWRLYLRFYIGIAIGAIMIIIGSILCFFPGIYLAISLCLVFAAWAHERKGFWNAISRSFQLTHMAWWWTLLILFVLYILLFVFSLALSIPTLGYNFSNAFHRLNNEQVTTGNMSMFVLLYSGLITTITNVLYIVPQVALAFQYFSLVERREKPTLLDKINEIGTDKTI